ncbi:MAG: CRISPR-associated endonuclease Cas3'', partial [Planctomycetaceae bacterium]|nr:CRISPR-associated endonuclease Cas3'' [Planctomycetaceae bacterium]
MTTHFAHTKQGEPPESWEPLEEHLALVAKYCSQFAHGLKADEFGRVLGWWHDLGKYSKEFQAYLHRENGYEAHIENVDSSNRIDHSTAGAQLAAQLFEKHPYGRMLAYCIAGHHAGLADAVSQSGASGLDQRLKKVIPAVDDAPPALLQKPELPKVPPISLASEDPDTIPYQLAFFTRMLFSCLVDADYLATEEFVSPNRTGERQVNTPGFAQLRTLLDQHLQELSAGKSGVVADARAEVLNACRHMAAQPRGLFSLTVPTGGGKTLSSLAFALKHAEVQGCSRIIYAIPFTSIIEQTAAVFRNVFSAAPEETILEHHCNTDPERETATTRLITQNWDAPLVVTTNVQLFESLFSDRTSSCRKLHNICNSVIILDEVQSIPVELLKPTLAVIRELVRNYGCTIVLCTATQPALGRSNDFMIGLENVTEIISNPPHLFGRLKRVQISHLGPLSNENIVQKLSEHEQFLCIVNTRAHAADLFTRLTRGRNTLSSHPFNPWPRGQDVAKPEATAWPLGHGLNEDLHPERSIFHLSTNMCGEHRRKTLDTIRQRLSDGLACQVISTQLIEAGVDVDFPVVFRSLTGIDSMAQAAGRCNREGKRHRGKVFLFEPTDVKLRGYLRATAESAKELLVDLTLDDIDLLNQEIVCRYFGLHF